MGTILSNFASESERTNMKFLIESRSFGAFESYHIYEEDERHLPPWNRPYFQEVNKLYPYLENWQYFTQVMEKMSNDPNLNVSALDVAPILTSVLSYSTQTRYSQQFKFTAAQQMWKDQENQMINGKLPLYPPEAANFFSEKNYLGKLLTPHLLLIMEIMHHSILRAGSLRENWMHHKIYDNKWKDILPFTHDLQNQPFSVKMRDIVTNNSLAYLPIHSYITDDTKEWKISKNFRNSFANINVMYDYREHLNFSWTNKELDERDRELDILRKKHQHRQFILFCGVGQTGKNCEQNFNAIITNKGICYAYNMDAFYDSLKNNTYNEHFKSIFGKQNKTENQPENKLGTGFKLVLILDSHQSTIFDYEHGHFEVSINQRKEALSVLGNSFVVDVGQHTRAQVGQVIKYGSSDSFSKLNPTDRDCIFEHERPEELTLFKNYTFKSCEFECFVRKSRDQCGCIPWNYPHLDEKSELCDGPSTYCFQSAMESGFSQEECGCQINCNEVKYLISDISRHDIDPIKECVRDPPSPRGQRLGGDSIFYPHRTTFNYKQRYDLSLLIAEKIR